MFHFRRSRLSIRALEILTKIIPISLALPQVFFQSLWTRVDRMRSRRQDLEWWMARRQLPGPLQERVDDYEQQHWAATRGIDEEAMTRDLPEGLRRDIKRYLCLDLVRKVGD